LQRRVAAKSWEAEEIEKRDLSFGTFEGVFSSHGIRRPAAPSRARAMLFLFDKNLLSRFLAFLRRHHWRSLDRCDLLIALLAVRHGLLPVRTSAFPYSRTR
jgi:hypothetical protein